MYHWYQSNKTLSVYIIVGYKTGDDIIIDGFFSFLHVPTDIALWFRFGVALVSLNNTYSILGYIDLRLYLQSFLALKLI